MNATGRTAGRKRGENTLVVFFDGSFVERENFRLIPNLREVVVADVSDAWTVFNSSPSTPHAAWRSFEPA